MEVVPLFKVVYVCARVIGKRPTEFLRF